MEAAALGVDYPPGLMERVYAGVLQSPVPSRRTRVITVHRTLSCSRRSPMREELERLANEPMLMHAAAFRQIAS